MKIFYPGAVCSITGLWNLFAENRAVADPPLHQIVSMVLQTYLFAVFKYFEVHRCICFKIEDFQYSNKLVAKGN